MKRVISMLLVLLTLLSLLSGMTFAADNVVEVNLRPGKTMKVASAQEFLAAYKKVYEPGSPINCIRLTANFNLFTAGLRTSGGYDPWMSGYENELCIRMPEGTCLDINGCTVAIRANQGLDDNGTGKASGLMTMGTVIDTLGTGRVNMQSINDIKYLQHAIDIAKKYPGIVKGVTVSKAMPGAENYEFVIPAGVCLRFSGTPSHLPAKKVTLEPGATVYKAVDSSPGFKGCKAVVLQYVDDADKERAGSEFATETVKVEGTVPVYPKVTYKINVEGGSQDAELVSRPLISYVEPKTINSASDATTDAAVILNPGEVKIWEPRKLTDAEVMTLVQDVALTYHYQSNEESHIQYDGRSISAVSDLVRKHGRGRPEDASFDSTVFSVCSDYCWKVYDMAFGMDYLFVDRLPRTRTWCDLPVGSVDVVVQYTGPDSTDSKGETDLQKAVAEARKAVRAGDVICYADKSSGHAMMFVGDLFGDGVDYILHCKGKSFDTATGEDVRETPGQCIELMKADTTVWGGDKASWSISRPAAVAKGFAILRPSLSKNFTGVPTKEGMARLQFPRLKITRELDRYKYAAVQTGEEVPVYLTIENKGKNTLNEIPVEEYIPAGTTLVEGSQTKGAKVEGSTIKWSVKVPAGKKITLTYKVKVNAKFGETVSFKSALVGGIASRATALQVGGVQLTAKQHKAIQDYGVALVDKTEGYKDLDFVNRFYADALGVNPGLPKTAAELVKKLTNNDGKIIYRTGKDPLDKMIIPLHFAGQRSDPTGGEYARVREFKAEYYEPGDIFVCLTGSNATSVVKKEDVDIFIYLGDARVLSYNTEGATLQNYASTIGSVLSHHLILALRPTLGLEDINARVAKKMAFTDVKEGEWYYEFVKKMFEDGIINGMTETTFAPKGNLTWGQALKLVALAVGEKEQAGGDHWASGYLKLAKDKKWLTKDVDLNANITRLDFCKVAAKAKKLTEMPEVNPFTDTASLEVMALYHAGVINGMTETTFAPQQLLTRAQISKIIALLVEL